MPPLCCSAPLRTLTPKARAKQRARPKARGQAKGKAQGQVKGQVQGADEAEGGDEGEGEDEAEGGGGQEKVTLCHKGKNTITVGAPAVAAHLAHDDTEGDCQGSTPPATPPDEPPGDCDLADTLDFVSQSTEGDAALVDAGDEYLLPGENLTLSADPTITVTDADGTSYTFNNTNATITEEAAGIRIVVTQSAPAELEAGADLTVDAAQGIECGEVTAIGALTTTSSGDVALRTKDGKGDSKAVPLVTQTQDQEKRLEELAASKLGKVKVTGAKVKDKSAKKVKGQKQKEALKVTSVKKANKKK